MRSPFLLFFVFHFFVLTAFTNPRCGYVYDAQTGERLFGVNIVHIASGMGTSSDERGFFCIAQHEDSAWLISRVGFRSDTLHFDEYRDSGLHIYLQPLVLELDEVTVVNSFTLQNFNRGFTYLTQGAINNIPAMGGEKDLIKAVTTLPGITMGMEGISSISIRGGGTEHNLFIVDGVPVYNTGHLFNFISVFNPEAIKDIAIYRHSFPTRYGGRLASVIDISLRDGNTKEMQIKADLGLINSKFSLEGPLGNRGKTSYMFAARSTYLDLFKHNRLKEIRETPVGKIPRRPQDRMNNSDFGYTFADVNFKLSHRFNNRNRFFFSLYSGIDYYRLEEVDVISRNSVNFTRSNYLASLKSFHMLSDRLMLELLVYANQHGNKQNVNSENYQHEVHWDPVTRLFSEHFSLSTQIRDKNINTLSDIAAEGHLSYALKGHGLLKGGFSFIHHNFRPTDYYIEKLDNDGHKVNFQLLNTKQNANQVAVYANIERQLWGKINLNTGLRLSGYISGSARYFRPEPRFSVGYSITEKDAIHLSYSIMQQYNHALTRNEQFVTNTIWVPSTSKIKPQRSEQLSLGYISILGDADYQFETYIYQKRKRDLVHYFISGENKFLYHNWQDYLLSGGKGRGFGWEVSFSKLKGIFTGNINYTFSRHFRQFKEVNRGQWFPYKYNREHVLNISGVATLNNNWSIGFYWTINSGARISLPDAYVNENPFRWGYFSYSGVNNVKLPLYHRLDLSFDWEKSFGDNHTLGISFNIYNAYYRKNSAYVFVGDKAIYDSLGNETDSYRVLKSKSIMPVIPSLNISYKFN